MGEVAYLNLLKDILNNGSVRATRNSETKSVFFRTLEFDLSSGELPLLTTKFVSYRNILHELLWFISGSTNTEDLSSKGVKIWDANSSKEFIRSQGLNYEEGDIGPGYGFQMRHSGGNYRHFHSDGSVNYPTRYEEIDFGMDQIEYVENLIKNNPTSRRICMTLWSPKHIEEMVLPCCFPAGTHVLTNNGYKSIERVSKSDKVMSHKGKYRKIKEIHKRSYSGEMFKIRFKCMFPVTCTPEHPFLVRERILDPSIDNDDQISKFSTPEWLPARDLNHTHMVGVKLNTKCVYPKLKIYSKVLFVSIPHKVDILEDDWFVIGYFLLNGFLTESSVGIKYKSAQDIDRLSRVLGKYVICRGRWLLFRNQPWVQILSTISPVASRVVKIPEWINDSPPECLVRMIDGITTASGSDSFSSDNIETVLAIQMLAFKAGYSATEIKYKDKTYTAHFRFSHGRYCSYMTNDYIWLPLVSSKIKKSDRYYVYNFDVDIDHSYTVNNMSVHNCHGSFIQFYVRDNKYLDCFTHQRSADVYLGLPYNIASYSTFVMMLAKVCDLVPGKLHYTIGDAHLYSNQYEAAKIQSERQPREFPKLVIKEKRDSITEFRYEDFYVEGYDPNRDPLPVVKMVA
jgi:thymidylate synthase